jgi:predicted RNA-binding Zn-ribbon protein involved in translation (DUF1610 family)
MATEKSKAPLRSLPERVVFPPEPQLFVETKKLVCYSQVRSCPLRSHFPLLCRQTSLLRKRISACADRIAQNQTVENKPGVIMAEKAAAIQCPECKGKGSITCSVCRGQGKQYGSNASQRPCAGCHGKGQSVCPRCKGTKKATTEK